MAEDSQQKIRMRAFIKQEIEQIDIAATLQINSLRNTLQCTIEGIISLANLETDHIRQEIQQQIDKIQKSKSTKKAELLLKEIQNISGCEREYRGGDVEKQGSGGNTLGKRHKRDADIEGGRDSDWDTGRDSDSNKRAKISESSSTTTALSSSSSAALSYPSSVSTPPPYPAAALPTLTSRNVLVTNLPLRCDFRDLKDFLRLYGRVEGVYVLNKERVAEVKFSSITVASQVQKHIEHRAFFGHLLQMKDNMNVIIRKRNKSNK